jgi:hypothetical protein
MSVSHQTIENRRISKIPFTNLVDIFFDPSKVFDAEAREPRALFPFIVVVLCMAVELLLLAGPMIEVAVHALPVAMRADMAPQVRDLMERNRIWGIALIPIIQGVRIVAISGIVYLGAAMASQGVDEEGGYHRALSIVAYASLALVVEVAVNLITLYFVGWHGATQFMDLTPVIGMQYLVTDPANHHVAYTVLQRLNPFTLLYAWLLTVGMRRIFRVSWLNAATVAATAVAAGIATVAVTAFIKG